MTTFKETFAGTGDRARVLTEVLRQGPAVPGTTLIALIDRTTQAVLAVRSLATPAPILDEELYFDDEQRHQLSVALREVALAVAPPRLWDSDRWGEITGELITVVCREGITAITPIEVQFFWGWRYSNHHTAALDGDVYVVTPQGWANLLPEWSGSVPALPSGPGGLGAAPEVQDAERVLADASLALLGPEPGECILCYVHRMLVEFGCDGRLRFATHYRDVRTPRATGLERRLGRSGGYCDCEIFTNGYDLREEYWVPEAAEPPDDPQDEDDDDEDAEETWSTPLPRCTQVRAGSTQPCNLWGRRYRR
jgi:hypothetical protein